MWRETHHDGQEDHHHRRPDSAAKTTFARSFLPAEADLPRFINADLIAAGFAPFAPDTAAIKAGRLMLEEISQSEASDENFAFETTLAGLSYLRHIARWRAHGRRVSLFFLSLSDAETTIARVAERIRRRFAAGLGTFTSRYRTAVDDWALYDNAGSSPTLVERGEHQ